MGVAAGTSGSKGSPSSVPTSPFPTTPQQAAGLGQSLLPTYTGIAAGALPAQADTFGPANVPMEVSPALQSVARASGPVAAPAPTTAPAPSQGPWWRRGGRNWGDLHRAYQGYTGTQGPQQGLPGPVPPSAPAAAIPGGKSIATSPLLQTLLGQMNTGAAQPLYQQKNYLNPAPAPGSVPRPPGIH